MLTLAKSFVMDPELLLIDELSLGLAPKVVEELLETLSRFNAEGVSILLVDQHVDLALDVARAPTSSNEARSGSRARVEATGPRRPAPFGVPARRDRALGPVPRVMGVLEDADRPLAGRALGRGRPPPRRLRTARRGRRRGRVPPRVRQRHGDRLRRPAGPGRHRARRRPRSGPRRPSGRGPRHRLHAAVYTHGHIDHVFGVGPFEEEAAAERLGRARGWSPTRTSRPASTATADGGYNALINRRQFGAPGSTGRPSTGTRTRRTATPRLSTELARRCRAPPREGRDRRRARWAWMPERRVLCTGDLFMLVHAERRATRRRSSATRPSGPRPCGAWRRWAPRSCCPATAWPIVGAGPDRGGADPDGGAPASRCSCRPSPS